MSNFTIKSQHHTSIVSLKESVAKGQVDIMVSAPDGLSYRVASVGNGKLNLFRFNTVLAEGIGLELDSGQFPVIGYIG